MNDLLEDMVVWPDNQNISSWYYFDIQEAANSHYFYRKDDGLNETWTELCPVRDWGALDLP